MWKSYLIVCFGVYVIRVESRGKGCLMYIQYIYTVHAASYIVIEVNGLGL